MEQVRFIAAIVLCFVLYLVWAYFFVPKPAVPPLGTTATLEAKATVSGEKALSVAGEATPTAATPVAVAHPVPAGRTFTVETPLYIARFSQAGGALKELTLKKFRESKKPDSKYKAMTHLPEGETVLNTKFEDGSVPELASALFSSNAPDRISVSGKSSALVLSWVSPTGVAVEKRYVFHPSDYVIDLDVTVTNRGTIPVSDSLSVDIKSYMGEATNYGFEGPLALIQGSLEEVKTAKLRKNGPATKTGGVFWSGLTDRYFLLAVAPAVPQEGAAIFSATQGPEKLSLVMTRYVNPKANIPPGAVRKYSHRIYMGPKSTGDLKAAGDKFSRALSFGMWSFIATPLLHLMDFIHGFIPNYGIAIMLVTLIIKLLFWPLSNKSYKSMAEMKKLTPLMQEIREKYKDDKKRMNEEVFALYRTYKVNPMSGCLPILLQIPVFFALWRMLSGAIELRHAPFWGWINDLSAPDRLMQSLNIPFVEPSGIPVLTLVMGVTMFIQQKMSPPPGDPMQAKMMMALPVVFTFIFINLPSGLVLYWLVNNVLSIGQQFYIQKKYS